MQLAQVLKEILKISLPKGWSAFINSFKKIWVWLIGSAGSFFSINNNVINNSLLSWIPFTQNNYLKFGIIFFCLLFVILILSLVKHFIIEAWRKYILISREAIYGNAIVLLSSAYAEIHKNRNKAISDEEVKTILQTFCDHVREIFKFKTKANCNVSIKVIVDFKSETQEINFQTELKNLVRDSNSTNRDTANYETITHKIANNTPYQIIMSNYFSGRIDKLYFLSNDLPSERDYQNSSLEQHPNFLNNYKDTAEYRKKNWPLPYKSELVVCLSPWQPLDEDGMPIIGFLCIDCELEGKEVFNLVYDVPMVRGIADGLHEFIKKHIFIRSSSGLVGGA